MHLLKSRRLGVVITVLAARFARDKPCFQQHLQMLGNGSERDVKMGAEFLHRARAIQQQIEKRSPVRIGNRLENIGGYGCHIHSFKSLLKCFYGNSFLR